MLATAVHRSALYSTVHYQDAKTKTFTASSVLDLFLEVSTAKFIAFLKDLGWG